MGLERIAEALEEECLRDVKTGEIGSSSGCIIEPDSEHGFGLRKKLAGLFQEASRLPRHSCRPSRRISSISGVGSP